MFIPSSRYFLRDILRHVGAGTPNAVFRVCYNSAPFPRSCARLISEGLEGSECWLRRERRSRVVNILIWDFKHLLWLVFCQHLQSSGSLTIQCFFFSRLLFYRECRRHTQSEKRLFGGAQVAKRSRVRGDRITLGAGDDFLNIHTHS